MPTKKQIEARRANARRSKGPVTAAGKAASAMNALKFGFYARDPVLPGEERAEFAAFRDELVAAYDPANAPEKILAIRIADAAWRLRRFPAVEAAILSHHIRKDEAEIHRFAAHSMTFASDVADRERAEVSKECQALLERAEAAEAAADHADYAIGRAFIADASAECCFTKLSQCETAIDRSMLRTMRRLEKMQAKRNKKVTSISVGREKEKSGNDLTEGLNPVRTAA